MSKVFFCKIDLEQLKPLITFAFEDDPDLLAQYSLLKTDSRSPSLNESVDKNYNTVAEAFGLPVYNYGKDIEIYEVLLVGKDSVNTIGFTVTLLNEEAPHMLFSFGININYRNLKINAKWLDQLKAHIGKYIAVTLHNNNTRAINFFIKNGFTAIRQEELSVTTLMSNYNEFGKIKAKQLEVSHGS